MRHLRAAAALLSTPPAAAHEALHWAAARTVGAPCGIEVGLTDAQAHAWTDLSDASAVAAAWVALAPTIIGWLLGGVVGAWWVLAGGDVPATVVGWAKLSIAGIAWSIVAYPSAADRDVAWRHWRDGGDQA